MILEKISDFIAAALLSPILFMCDRADKYDADQIKEEGYKYFGI